jgi:hypothetical protein
MYIKREFVLRGGLRGAPRTRSTPKTVCDSGVYLCNPGSGYTGHPFGFGSTAGHPQAFVDGTTRQPLSRRENRVVRK